MSCLRLSNSLARQLIYSLLLSILYFTSFVSATISSLSPCSCYKTSGGSVDSIFQYYTFYDFRSIPREGTNTFGQPPQPVAASQDNGSEAVTASFFSNASFTNAWVIQSWTRNASQQGPVKLVNSAQNVFILDDSPSSIPSTHLTLRSSRLPTFQSSSQLCTATTNMLYASIRVRARVAGSPGAVAGLFLYGNPANETDTEILTRDPPTEARLTNQPGMYPNESVIPGASSVVGIATPNGMERGNLSSRGDWNIFRFDWVQGQTEWLVNNVSVARKGYGVPSVGCYFALNVWSDGGSWSGEMGVENEASMDVQWVEIVWNASGSTIGGAPAGGGSCGDGEGMVCAVDGNGVQLGTPAVVSEASSGRLGQKLSWAGMIGAEEGRRAGAAVESIIGFLVLAWLFG